MTSRSATTASIPQRRVGTSPPAGAHPTSTTSPLPPSATGVHTHHREVGPARDQGLEHRFIASRCADEGFPKPHPDMLLRLIECCGVEASETLMIGDTCHDVELAHNAGALRPDTLSRVRVPIYLSRRVLERDFADWTSRRPERDVS